MIKDDVEHLKKFAQDQAGHNMTVLELLERQRLAIIELQAQIEQLRRKTGPFRAGERHG